MRNPLFYHIFFRTKYRQAIGTRSEDYLLTIGRALAEQFGAEILEYAIHQSDHVHLIIALPATSSALDFTRNWKSATARLVNKDQATTGQAFWQKRFLIKTISPAAGNLKRVRDYVKNGGKHVHAS